MSSTEKWTDALLDQMRRECDPKADQAAEALLCETDGYPKQQVARFIGQFVSHDFTKPWVNNSEIPDPPELMDYFNDLSDYQLTQEEMAFLDKGSAFFEKHGPWATFALGVRSLLKQYAHTKAIEVLRVTTLLEKHVNRRIMETMQFVMDVMQPGWTRPKPDGTLALNLAHPGVLSTKKLRLVHAMVRFRIHFGMYDHEQLGVYDLEKLGEPINQEDMVFAIHTFSLEIIQGLREMRMEITNQEAEDFFQCWKIIGRMLGIDRRLEPANYADGVALQDKIYARHFTLPNNHGPILAKALTDWFLETVPFLKDKTLVTVIKDFNGPENLDILADHLGIDLGDCHPDLQAHLESDYKFELKIEGDAKLDKGQPSREDTLDKFFLSFLQALISRQRGGKNDTFRIGDGFGAAWNLNQMAEKPESKEETFLFALKMIIDRLLRWLGIRKGEQQPG